LLVITPTRPAAARVFKEKLQSHNQGGQHFRFVVPPESSAASEFAQPTQKKTYPTARRTLTTPLMF